MKLSPHFDSKEFDCKCGCGKRPENVPSQRLLELLEEIREHYGVPITINSGFRCPEHNRKVGGAANSQHTVGSAADFTVRGVPTNEVHKFVLSIYGNEPLGIAVKHNKYDPFLGFVHLDTRGTKARWTYS